MALNETTNRALKERQASEEFTVIGFKNVLLKIIDNAHVFLSVDVSKRTKPTDSERVHSY